MILKTFMLACSSTECAKHASIFVCKCFKEKEWHMNLLFFLLKQKLFLCNHRLIRSSVEIINLILLKASETTIDNYLMVCFLIWYVKSKELHILKIWRHDSAWAKSRNMMRWLFYEGCSVSRMQALQSPHEATGPKSPRVREDLFFWNYYKTH